VRRYLHVTPPFRFLGLYLRPHRVAMAVLGAILAVTILMQIATPFLAARFIDRATAGEPLGALITLAIATMLLAIGGQVLAVGETWVAERVSWDATNALRIDLAAHLLRLDASFHNAHTQGEMIERVDGDVGTLARFFSRFVVNVVGNGILIFGILSFLWVIDWRIGLGLTAFVAVALVAMLRIRKVATPDWVAERQTSADFYGFLGEYLAGLEDVRSSGRSAQAFVLRRFYELMRGWLKITTRAQMWGYAMVATSQGVFALGMAFALGVSGVLFHAGSLTLGTVFLVFRLTDMLRGPTEQLRDEVQDFQQADASLGRIQALLAGQPRIVDGRGTHLPPGPLAVEFERVTFGYLPDTPILHDISVKVEPGRVLGIVGRTGSGKTTLTRLVPRFLDPTSGVVRVGGVDVRETLLTELRRRIGVVTQDVHLFDASLRDNLTLFADPDTTQDDRLREVLAALDLGDWLRDLPDGLGTMLGAGGIGLSAGQMQVLSCARILLHDPDVVILDEASARLDPATERLVHTALGRLLADRTGIIVAHRLTTLAYADDILVLIDGEVREHGPREVLAADPSSHFATLLRLDALEIARW
ncbi:MAG: ABC transporter ATP-binding protein, partial [Thermomicrobiales bacterium]